MRLPLLILTFGAIFTFGFQTPGTYERVFLWYAYRITPGNLIAPGCGRDCSFNQFNAYINKVKLKPPPIVVGVDENGDDKNGNQILTPSVSETADKLNELNLNGEIDFRRTLSKYITFDLLFVNV